MRGVKSVVSGALEVLFLCIRRQFGSNLLLKNSLRVWTVFTLMVIMAIVMVVRASSSPACGLPREPRPWEPQGWSWVWGEGPAPHGPHAGSEQRVSSPDAEATSCGSSRRALTLMHSQGKMPPLNRGRCVRSPNSLLLLRHPGPLRRAKAGTLTMRRCLRKTSRSPHSSGNQSSRIENAPQATRARLRTTQLATLRHFSIELSVSGYETYVPLDGSL